MVSTRSSSRIEDSPPAKSPSSANGRRRAANSTAKSSPSEWRYTPTRLTLQWMAISLPLVIWDTIYVLGRPLTMEGGSLHWPLWVPYKLYGEVDYVYGWYAFNARDGFTSAQGLLNLVETAMYLTYLYTVFTAGGKERVVTGRAGAKAVLLGFSAAVMTLSKTVLYWANEYFSGFRHIGHNTPLDLVFLWIIPNGAWLIGSAYMIWEMSGNIVDGLAAASTQGKDE